MSRPTKAMTAAFLVVALAAASVTLGQPSLGGAPPGAESSTFSPMAAARGARPLIRNGKDYLSYGEYERALDFFTEAEGHKDELTPAEQKDLQRGIDQARRGLREAANAPRKVYARSGSTARPGAIAMATPEAAPKAKGTAPEPVQLVGATVVQPSGAVAATATTAAEPAAPPAPEPIEPPALPSDPLMSTATPAAPAAPAPLAEGPTFGRGVAQPPPAGEPAPQPSPAAITPAAVQEPTTPTAAPTDSPAELPALPAKPTPAATTPEPAPLALAQATPTPTPAATSTDVPSATDVPAVELPPLPTEPTPPADPTVPTADPEPIPSPRPAEPSIEPLPTEPATRPEARPLPATAAAAAPDAADLPSLPAPAPEAVPEASPLPATATGSATAPVEAIPTPADALADPIPAVAEAPVAAPAEPAAPAPVGAAPAPTFLPSPFGAEALPPLPGEGHGRGPAGRSPFTSLDDLKFPRSFSSSLTPEQRREVERIATLQEEESRDRGNRPPAIPNDLMPPSEQPMTRLELPRAPSPSEARPLRSIPVPEDFVPLGPRQWSPQRKYWAAAATCHTPLYFQDATLERYGYSVEQHFGPAGRFLTYPIDDPKQSKLRNQILQPAFSAGLFAAQIALWPVNLVLDPPWEAEYDLGYYRPGDRVPTDVYYLPLHGVGPPVHGLGYRY